MKSFDRIILSFIAVGIWTSIIMFNTHSRDAFAQTISVDQIDDLEFYIQSVVEGCTVSGSVEVEEHEYGNFSDAVIGC
ncbi:MAG: hypothetical protein ACE1ZM_05445 [Gammaproteobacteria bacterium]